ncbi:MAG: 50S ribosomal protein L22 [Candidatus Omnitrophota bacterium]|jgi:large subunit ribosomal protein L22
MKKEKNPKNPVIEAPAVVSDKRAVAKLKHLRIGPRKMRLVIDAVRTKPVGRAFEILMVLKKKAARMVEKIMKTAVANAKVLGMDENRLVVAEIKADGGPVMKRFMARSMGRADRILKRTTHLTLILKEGGKAWAGPVAEEAAKAEEAKPGKEKKASKASAKAGGKKKAAAAAS